LCAKIYILDVKLNGEAYTTNKQTLGDILSYESTIQC